MRRLYDTERENELWLTLARQVHPLVAHSESVRQAALLIVAFAAIAHLLIIMKWYAKIKFVSGMEYNQSYSGRKQFKGMI